MSILEFQQSGAPVGQTITIKQEFFALAGAAAKSFDFFNKNSRHRFQVLDFWTIQTAAGPAASSTLRLRQGDGADSEVFANISNALAIGTIADQTVTRVGTIDNANHEVDVDESLNIVAVASSGTHSFIACVTILLLPVAGT